MNQALDHRPLNIVCIGGGTGLSCLLSGMKRLILDGPICSIDRSFHIKNLSAVVTVSDDGGSSGRIREELNVLPPGDVRNCLVALANDELLMTELFRYRFTSTGDLRDHSFGNLFLAALTGITGDFAHAVRLASDVLAIHGRVHPSTTENVYLVAELADGSVRHGETQISSSSRPIRRLQLEPAVCHPVEGTLEAIREADIITLGPGSLYTSVICNLLVTQVSDAITRSHARKIYICNIMTQPGETSHFTASQHIRAIMEHAPGLHFDAVLLNDAPVSATLLDRYRAEQSEPVRTDLEELKQLGIRSFSRPLICESDTVRHKAELLARVIFDIYDILSSEQHESFFSQAR
jgi:uncharacterized cofD-like protein